MRVLINLQDPPQANFVKLLLGGVEKCRRMDISSNSVLGFMLALKHSRSRSRGRSSSGLGGDT